MLTELLIPSPARSAPAVPGCHVPCGVTPSAERRMCPFWWLGTVALLQNVNSVHKPLYSASISRGTDARTPRDVR